MKQPSVAWPQLEFLIVLSFECAVPEPLCTFTRARASTIYGVPSRIRRSLYEALARQLARRKRVTKNDPLSVSSKYLWTRVLPAGELRMTCCDANAVLCVQHSLQAALPTCSQNDSSSIGNTLQMRRNL
jgi:hypothetical protein